MHTASTFVQGHHPFRDDVSGASKPLSTLPKTARKRSSRNTKANQSLDAYIARCERKIADLRGKKRGGDMVDDEATFLELKKTNLLVEHFKYSIVRTNRYGSK